MATTTIRGGEWLPDGVLYYIDRAGVIRPCSVRGLFCNKRVILLGLTGAFTPGCSCNVLPGYIETAPRFKAKGVNHVYCLTANDPFVVKAWADTFKGNEHVQFLSDGSATYIKALGMDIDLHGFGVRGRRFVLFVDNLQARIVSVESGPGSLLTAEQLLQRFI